MKVEYPGSMFTRDGSFAIPDHSQKLGMLALQTTKLLGSCAALPLSVVRLNALSRLSRSFPGIVPTFQHVGICKLSSQGFPCQGAFVALPTGENNLLAGHHWWQLVHPVIQEKNPGTPRNSSVGLALYLSTRTNVHEDSTLPHGLVMSRQI